MTYRTSRYQTKPHSALAQLWAGSTHLASVRTVSTAALQPSKMALPPSAYKDRQFLAVIGDEVRGCGFQVERHTADITAQDSVTGLLLAGIGVSPAGTSL